MRSICTAVVATLAIAGTSFAATINVPGDQPTIRDAIGASSDGDVIAIAAGTYNEHTLNPSGKAITIGSASGNLDVTIDAQQGGGVFVIESGEGDGTVIMDLVITGGSGNEGGGIYCDNSNPTITNCTISNNTANFYGGGIYCWYSNPTITDCTITGNTANFRGGGIWGYNSNPTIIGCTITGNTGFLSGGGVYCINGNPTIMDSTICGNDPDQIYGDWTDNGGNTVADECPIPEGACCVGSSCSVETEADCVSAGGTYQGDNSDCSDGLCYGACCVTSGCDVMAEVMCTNLGGTWLGAGGSCDDCVPAEPTGACCVTSGCHALTEDACAGMGGTWLGEGGSCDDCPASCMGDTDGNGVVNIEDLLNMLGSWGACP